jgi:hypothetical protein
MGAFGQDEILQIQACLGRMIMFLLLNTKTMSSHVWHNKNNAGLQMKPK